MKKTVLTQLASVFAFVINITIVSTTYTTTVSLKNSYGKTLKYILADPKISPTEYVLPVNAQVELGDINLRDHLYIRTTGAGSGYGLSPYNNLEYYLTQIKEEKSDFPNSNAVINIGSSYLRWYITVQWEKDTTPLSETFPPENTKEIINPEKEAKFMELDNPKENIKALKRGDLGAEYAKKVNLICNSDYTEARNKGKPNLCNQLNKELRNEGHSIKDLKKQIDLLFRKFNEYRTEGLLD